MIILQCDKCGKQVAWYKTDTLPKEWAYKEGSELCEECYKEYIVFEKKARAKFDAEIAEFFK